MLLCRSFILKPIERPYVKQEIKKVLYKKEQQQSRFYWNRAHSNCSSASLKWFRKLHVHHAFLINDDKILSSLLNLYSL